MYRECVPFRKRALYLTLTVPMGVIFFAVAVHLLLTNTVAFFVFGAMLATVILAQSYCCAYQDCPYIGGFCPGIGGATVLSSRIALLLAGVRKSEKLFNLFSALGTVCLLGIIVLPLFFMHGLGIAVPAAYFFVAVLYLIIFFLMICPGCAIRDSCPGGKMSTKLLRAKDGNGA